MRHRWIFWVPLAIAGMIAFIVLGGGFVMWLWNWLVPPLFGWKAITFWQAIGLLALCRILFGGVAGRGGHHGGRMPWRIGDRLADRVAERWQRMSPEERERFRQRMRERCGFDPGAAETKTL
jgi:uncharacterized membrane protein